MKRIFMIAATAALGLGAYSCETNPGGGGGDGGDGTRSGMRLSIALPGAGAGTRASNNGPIDASENESSVQSVYVFLFNADGTAAAYGGMTEIAGDDFGVYFPTSTTTSGTVKYEMAPGKTIEATVGNDMKLWVGLNLPGTAVTTLKAYVADEELTEAKLKAVISDVAALDVADAPTATAGLAMFSVSQEEDVLKLQDGVMPAANEFTVPIYRTIAKVVASAKGATSPVSFGMKWTITTDTGDDIELSYSLSHWRIFQDAIQSYLAPRYTPGATTGRPETYRASINDYAASKGNAEKAFVFTTADVVDADLIGNSTTGLDAAKRMYIGENASVGTALNGNTTHAYISTKLRTAAMAMWEPGTAPAVANGSIVWKTTDEWGADLSDTDGTKGDDIWVIKTADGNLYFTQADQVEAISKGVYNKVAHDKNIRITDEADDNESSNGIEMTKDAFDSAYPEAIVTEYVYHKGYVHFITWINRIGTNVYDVLRNEFIHLDVTGLNASKSGDGKFPGYPGDETNPRIPTDPEEEDNNPDPLDPLDPVEPEKSQIQVNVEIRPWTYRYNKVELGR